MSADNKVQMLSPMQEAFINAAVDGHRSGRPSKLAQKVNRGLGRTRVPEVRSWDAKVSFRTAQKLKQAGVL